MEKKDLLAVRKRLPAAAAKRRHKVVTPAKAGAGRLAKVIAGYLASDSYMYAPLISAPPSLPPPPPASSVAPSATPLISTPVTKLHPKPHRGKAAKDTANLLKAIIVSSRESLVRQRLNSR
ncbi:uncharacterized protein [Zea mays]|uniref:uncharacterized protein isoform X1 n=1 Tax=Zea mays TaxID=4577 RepID=UPI0004DEA9B1|nr:uncharacterized protein LOC100275270 isoform X1 [Zea mays]|eukprot:XP_023157488.1 uncharacterized protein LOC100275270 isoform X1 [Zea mays]